MKPRQPKLRARKRARQEGAALLIVLFVLMMATTTAVYTLSSSQMEVRAAGGLHQAMRAKFVSEAAAMGLLAFCEEKGVVGCVTWQGAPANVAAGLRQTYALPDWGGEVVYQVDPTMLTNPSFTANGAPLVASDATLAGGAGSAWTASFLTVYERWDVPGANGEQKPRIIVSTYGALTQPDDTKDATNELRDAHSTISATRVFIDIKN